MKKNIIIAAIAAASALLLSVSCQKDEMRESGNGVNGTFTGTIEQGPTKTTLTSENKVNWESGDKININGKSYTATPDGSDATKATFTADAGEATPDVSSKYKAVYPSTLYVTDHLELPATQAYAEGKFNMPMYAESSTTSLAFKNICGVLAITVNGTDFTSVSSIEVSSDKQMNGKFTATDAGALTFESVTLADADKKVTLNFASAKAIGTTESATFYIPVPAATHNPLTIKVSGGATTKTMVTKKSGGVEVERSKIYPITFADNLGALAGVFTVNAENKQVHFSQGNLYWDGDSFEFETNQYDIQSSWSTSHISHFFWSKTASVAYAGDYSDGEASNSDVFFTNAETETAKSDFTVNGVTGKYRTLSMTEWQYLFSDSRMDYGKPCYSSAVSGVAIGGSTYKGVFLYPDNYSGDVISDNSMTWDEINASGIVFLPAAGDRYHSNVSNVDDRGCYWSSTAQGSDNKAYFVYLVENAATVYSGTYGYGCSVRLVTE